ncbi:unannotated protein [freshwater metagenome]|uniref:Unannotated protein n=1 Tax=freshwater metagenome TaxID=449393 RepID=A0A6J7RHQ3_9ZZZZ|nr:SDR family oxidoreductase [Actinomycetota bacterium]MSW36012.1 SDR family oxidoreductase [Actinomycetota bacterium]MSX39143.1 SDR family oxidoreductase [Actinomycetota bacterium]
MDAQERFARNPAGGFSDISTFDGRVAIVTGGANGMGEAVVHTLSRRGAVVIIADLNVERAAMVQEEASRGGREVVSIPTDVRDEEQVKELVAKVVADYGRIDFLDNNAADLELTAFDPDLVGVGLDTFEATMRGNVTAPFLCCKYVIPEMLKLGAGSIVNMASVSGMLGETTLTAYGISKAAIIQLTRMVAVQYGKQGIRCNAIAPSLINTLNNQKYMPVEFWPIYERHHLTAYIGETQDIANVVAFLASDESRFITGALIPVDGGASASASIVADRRG